MDGLLDWFSDMVWYLAAFLSSERLNNRSEFLLLLIKIATERQLTIPLIPFSVALYKTGTRIVFFGHRRCVLKELHNNVQ